MPIDNAFATHPGRVAENAEKFNEDFAHAWVKDGVSYQVTADGNHRTDMLNPAPLLSMRFSGLSISIPNRR